MISSVNTLKIKLNDTDSISNFSKNPDYSKYFSPAHNFETKIKPNTNFNNENGCVSLDFIQVQNSVSQAHKYSNSNHKYYEQKGISDTMSNNKINCQNPFLVYGSASFNCNNEGNVENNHETSSTKITKLCDNSFSKPIVHRTADQKSAFHCIKDVHNYAKLNHHNYSKTGYSLQYDENVENDESYNEEGEDDDIDDIEYMEDLPTSYQTYFINKQKQLNGNLITVSALEDKKNEKAESNCLNVDVDIVDPPEVSQSTIQSKSAGTPEHHARRPMNAFLIFCKRHRAIVKEKYKNLENRAITKILGDWWASLDASDKECFTNLAQQNKDAFFSANPNFKWYKLPAPPLRTLNTRPSNAEQHSTYVHQQKSYDTDKNMENNLFKLADEAQMGEIKTLLDEKAEALNSPLHQTLGETNQFLNKCMTYEVELDDCRKNMSSYIGEDICDSKKNTRTCKGKIYQDLVDSGQITAVGKKAKRSFKFPCRTEDIQSKEVPSNESIRTSQLHIDTATSATSNCFEPESLQHFELSNFDLEERIKELPALSLETYLKRKRNIKKKQKFTTKKRKCNNVLNKKDDHTVAEASLSISPLLPNSTELSRNQLCKNQFTHLPQVAVGSQKRKARKESITRRDISAIESEVASLIPIKKNRSSTINECFFYNEASNTIINQNMSLSEQNMAQTVVGTNGNTISQLSNAYKDTITSSTSDLFILAEVAANSSQLTN